MSDQTCPARTPLGFIGTGIMGSAMVQRLLNRGWKVTAWNREPEALPPLVAAGAAAADDPGSVADRSEIVLMCVLDAKAVEECVFSPRGIASARQAPRLVIDLSTTDPVRSREFAARLRGERGIEWVDAPVSGGPGAARSGTLTVMAGGSEDAFATARPVLDDLAAKLTWLGPVGAGQTAKLVNQAIVCAGYVLMAEALALAEASGLDAAAVPGCLEGGLADSQLLRRLYPQMQQRDFDPPRNYARQVLKDLKAVVEHAGRADLALPLVATALERFSAYVDAGHAMHDSAGIIDLYKGGRDGASA